MNKYLKAAVSRDKRKEYKISPISQNDAEIIVEVIEILRKKEIDDVKMILSEYKFLADSEIRDALIQWNIDNPDASINDSKEKKKLIKLKGNYFKDTDIRRIKVDGLYIVINPSINDKETISNFRIKLDDYEELEEALSELLKIFDVIEII